MPTQVQVASAPPASQPPPQPQPQQQQQQQQQQLQQQPQQLKPQPHLIQQIPQIQQLPLQTAIKTVSRAPAPSAAPQSPSSIPYRLAFSLSVIYGSFTLGFYVAIQGPTLMDLIDLLHVNNDIMSYSLAFASLAYSLGGLLSGFLFNYVDRQILIPGYYIVFGVANAITPYISNYYIFSAITVFKMMCAGGTDCGANVWILDMWPGQDAWLQALHFSFAIGTALGPLVVEPFLSAGEHKDNTELEARLKDNNGHALISDQASESRIYIPYGVSGATSLFAAAFLIYLHVKSERLKREESRQRIAKQLAAGGEHILMNAVQHPAAIESGIPPQLQSQSSPTGAGAATGAVAGSPARTGTPTSQVASLSPPQPAAPAPAPNPLVTKTQLEELAAADVEAATALLDARNQQQQQQQQQQQLPASNNSNNLPSGKQVTAVKFTSKARQMPDGRQPYYVMFAIALCALCLSFYCGIEITSMNYLATFAVNIDLQLPKSTAAYMSSALTISFAVGRLIGIWIAAYMKSHKLFYLCSCVMATGNLCILLFANTTETLLWYSICLFGIGCGPMYASIVSFYDDRISKVTNTVSGIFILGSMFNVALNSLIIGHYIIDNALILIVCNLIGSVLLMLLFGSLHLLTRVKKSQRKRKFKLQNLRQASAQLQAIAAATAASAGVEPPVGSLEGSPAKVQQRASKEKEAAAAAVAAAAAAVTAAAACEEPLETTPLASKLNADRGEIEVEVTVEAAPIKQKA